MGVGRSVTLDLSSYFTDAATGFEVSYDRTDSNRGVDVTLDGSVATIQGLRTGTTIITLVATAGTSKSARPATIQVTN